MTREAIDALAAESNAAYWIDRRDHPLSDLLREKIAAATTELYRFLLHMGTQQKEDTANA